MRFFLFGMGQRAKFIYRDGKLLDASTGAVVREWTLGGETIVPPDYEVTLQTAAGAMMALAFKETGNLPVIRDWILGLREVYETV